MYQLSFLFFDDFIRLSTLVFQSDLPPPQGNVRSRFSVSVPRNKEARRENRSLPLSLVASLRDADAIIQDGQTVSFINRTFAVSRRRLYRGTAFNRVEEELSLSPTVIRFFSHCAKVHAKLEGTRVSAFRREYETKGAGRRGQGGGEGARRNSTSLHLYPPLVL